MESILTSQGRRSALTSLRVGWFLALRDLKRANKWSTMLISLVMTLTFLNLIVVWGILVGLVEGAVAANRNYTSGDIFITSYQEDPYIRDGSRIIKLLDNMPGVTGYSARYNARARVESGYKEQLNANDLPDSAAATLIGIDPAREEALSGLSQDLTDGSFLAPGDTDMIILGQGLMEEDPFDQNVLRNIQAGDQVRIIVNGSIIEVTVKGILKTKANSLDQSILMIDSQARQLLGRENFSFNEIAVRLSPEGSVLGVQQALIANDADKIARIETFEESQPPFLKDIQGTFAILGTVIGSIGLVVAAITIFIVIFVTAITRRKYIGILKGIGINALAIEFSYMFQSIFYACAGICIGWIVLYSFLVPYIKSNPVDFPFSDGILLAPVPQVALRAAVLLIATIIAGFVPARIVASKNTLDSILGR